MTLIHKKGLKIRIKAKRHIPLPKKYTNFAKIFKKDD